jgi:hypothetical protein
MVLQDQAVLQESLEFPVLKAHQDQRDLRVVAELVHKVRQGQLAQQVVVQLERKVQLEQPVRVVRREQLDRLKLLSEPLIFQIYLDQWALAVPQV